MKDTNIHSFVKEAAALKATDSTVTDALIDERIQGLFKPFADIIKESIDKEKNALLRRRYYLSEQATQKLDSLAAQHNVSPSLMLENVIQTLIVAPTKNED